MGKSTVGFLRAGAESRKWPGRRIPPEPARRPPVLSPAGWRAALRGSRDDYAGTPVVHALDAILHERAEDPPD